MKFNSTIRSSLQTKEAKDNYSSINWKKETKKETKKKK